MKKRGLLISAVLLGGVIVLLGTSAVVLEITDGVPKIKQISKEEKITDTKIENYEPLNVTKEYDAFTINNPKALLNNNTEDSNHENNEADGASDDYKLDEETEKTEEEADKVEKENKKKNKKKNKNSYLWADSSKKKLTEDSAYDIIEKVENMEYVMPGARSAARMIINELYAKHGAKFKDKEVQKFFNNKKWYKKIKKKVSTDKAFSKMSKIEKSNIEILDKIDKEN